jgi:hypothetical protein
MQYRLRTLLILLAIGPLMLAGAWFGAKAVIAYNREQERIARLPEIKGGFQSIPQLKSQTESSNPAR